MPPDSIFNPRPSGAWLQTLGAWLLACVFVLPASFDPIVETDIGWHLALGRLIGEQGIPETNALSWTYPDQPWYPTSWLYDVLAFRAIDAWGPVGLQAFTFAWMALLLAGLVVACRTVSAVSVWAVPAVALLMLPRVTERPELASMAVMAWALAFCMRGREGGWGWRAACVPLIALGSNLHSGTMFAVGVVGFFSLEAALRQWKWSREALIVATCALALIANPGGLFNVVYMVQHLSVQDVLDLGEFRAPTWKSQAWFFIAAIVSLAGAWLVRRQMPSLLPMVVVFAALGLRAVRLIYVFALVAALSFAWLLERAARLFGNRSVVLASAVALVLMLGWRHEYVFGVELAPRFDANALPVRASAFLGEEALKGRYYMAMRDGGFFEYALPGWPAFQDARIQAYPPQFWSELLAAEESPESFEQDLLKRGAEGAVVSRRNAKLTGKGPLDPERWALVYWDPTHEISLRRDVKRWAASIDRLEYRLLRPYGSPVRLLATLDGEGLARFVTELDRYEQTSPGEPLMMVLRCAAERRSGAPAAKESCGLAASLVADDPRLQKLHEQLATLPPVESAEPQAPAPAR